MIIYDCHLFNTAMAIELLFKVTLLGADAKAEDTEDVGGVGLLAFILFSAQGCCAATCG